MKPVIRYFPYPEFLRRSGMSGISFYACIGSDVVGTGDTPKAAYDAWLAEIQEKLAGFLLVTNER